MIPGLIVSIALRGDQSVAQSLIPFAKTRAHALAEKALRAGFEQDFATVSFDRGSYSKIVYSYGVCYVLIVGVPVCERETEEGKKVVPEWALVAPVENINTACGNASQIYGITEAGIGYVKNYQGMRGDKGILYGQGFVVDGGYKSGHAVAAVDYASTIAPADVGLPASPLTIRNISEGDISGLMYQHGGVGLDYELDANVDASGYFNIGQTGGGGGLLGVVAKGFIAVESDVVSPFNSAQTFSLKAMAADTAGTVTEARTIAPIISSTFGIPGSGFVFSSYSDGVHISGGDYGDQSIADVVAFTIPDGGNDLFTYHKPVGLWYHDCLWIEGLASVVPGVGKKIHSLAANGRLVAKLAGSAVVGDVVGETPTAKQYETILTVNVSLVQIEGAVAETAVVPLYTAESFSHLGNKRAAQAEMAGSDPGYTLLCYPPRGLELTVAPSNSILVSESRESRTMTNALDAALDTGVRALFAVHRDVMGEWSTVPICDTSAHVVRWAQDGSAFIARKWASFNGDGEYLEYSVVYFDGTGFVHGFDIISPDAPRSTAYQYAFEPFHFFATENLEAIYVSGSAGQDGIYLLGGAGYERITTSADGIEPVFMSPGGRCVATATAIYIEGILAASPANCCGVFHQCDHYLDLIDGEQFVIKNMDGDIVDAAPAGLYNMACLSDDSSVAVLTKSFSNDVPTSDKNFGPLAFVSLVDGPAKFEYSDVGHLFFFDKDYFDSEWVSMSIKNKIRNFGYAVAPGIMSSYVYAPPTNGVDGRWITFKRKNVAPVWVYGSGASEVLLTYRAADAIKGQLVACPYSDGFKKRRDLAVADEARIASVVSFAMVGIFERFTNENRPITVEERTTKHVREKRS